MFYDDARLMRMANIKNEKVYCGDCKYYKKSYYIGILIEDCTHPDNRECKDTYREKELKYKLSPRTLNKNNDCKWFEEKKGAFSFFKNLCK